MKSTTIFLPLFFVYICIVVIFSSNEFIGDEARYYRYATNLTNGFYAQDGEITNGPGYPIFLMPFIFLKIPLIVPKLLNSVLLFAAIIYFYNTLRLYITKKCSIFSTYLLGFYFPIYKQLPILHTEPLAFFLICGFIFYCCKTIKKNKFIWTQIIFSALYLSLLALTKSMFGYVVLVWMIIFIFLYFIKKSNSTIKCILIGFISLTFCLPYLIYTYSLTNKFFYWVTNGGEELYFMSTPYQKEFGDWIWLSKKNKYVYDISVASKNHLKFFNELSVSGLKGFQKDTQLRKRAIYNIIHFPKKYLQNWTANILRLFFNYPKSYHIQDLRAYFYMLPNMILIVLSLLCVYPTYLGRKNIGFEIKALILFSLVYIMGSSVVSANARYFIPIVPIIMLWLSIISKRIIKFEILK